MIERIAAARLRNQFITRRFRGSPAELVERFGAVQAQEYPFARWGLGLRLAPAPSDAAISEAFDTGQILRTHVMRPTWHFVTPADIRWLLQLTGPRVQRVLASYTRREGLSPSLLTKAAAIFERELGGGTYLTRAELRTHLQRAGLVTSSTQLGFIAIHAELEALICSGPRRGKSFTYALVSERAPSARRLTRDEALAELTRRYFTTHGPATVRDFVWWSGLTTGDTRRGLEMIGARRQTIAGLDYWETARRPRVGGVGGVHLLPIYDEYLVAYRDRVAVPHGPPAGTGPKSSVIFRHALVSAGAIVGTWNIRMIRGACAIDVTPLRRLTRTEKDDVAEEATRFGRFLGVESRLRIALA